MEKHSLYIKVFFLPLFATSLKFLHGFSLLFFLVSAGTEWIIIEDYYVNAAIVVVSIVLSIVFMWNRYSIFECAGRQVGLLYLISASSLAFPAIASHYYLLSKSGDIVSVANPRSIDLDKLSLYYQFENVCYDKENMKSEWDEKVTGRNRESLELNGVLIMPLLANANDTAQSDYSVWVAEFEYSSFSSKMKQSDLQAEINNIRYTSGKEFLDIEKRTPEYFELLRPNEANYNRTIRMISTSKKASDNFIVLLPHFSKFAFNGQVSFFLILLSLVLTQMFWILVCFMIDTDDGKLLKFYNSLNKKKSSIWLS